VISYDMKIHVYDLGEIRGNLGPKMMTLCALLQLTDTLICRNNDQDLQMLQGEIDPTGDESRRYSQCDELRPDSTNGCQCVESVLGVQKILR
jgi:hypothetical protein